MLKLGIPVIQAPMAGGITTVEMVASVANSGMLGMIPSGYLTIEELEQFVFKVKRALKPKAMYGINIFIQPEKNVVTEWSKSSVIIDAECEVCADTVSTHFQVPVVLSENEYIDFIIKHGIPIVSTTFGLLSQSAIERLLHHNVVIIATVTSMVEAKLATEVGISCLILQGSEAGGHQATFHQDSLNTLSTADLMAMVKAELRDVTIIVSGGVSIENFKLWLSKGADYVQMGSIFMMSSASGLSLEAKNHIQTNFQTTVTNKITGRYARGIINAYSHLGEPPYCFPIQHYHTSELRKKAKQAQCFAYCALWVGENPDNLEIIQLDMLLNRIKIYFNDLG